MTRRTKIMWMIAFLPAFASAKTIYSGEFDYHYLKSPELYFSGRTAAQIAHMCDTGEHVSNEDLEECSHLKFNRVKGALDKKLMAVRSKIASGDKAMETEGEPAALPYFERAQSAWVMYRDNECYNETYMMGEAAERYIFFWECMANITQSRARELGDLLKD